jgi:hypothetical protein
MILAWIGLFIYSLVAGYTFGIIICVFIALGIADKRRRAKQIAYRHRLIARARRESHTSRPRYVGPRLIEYEVKDSDKTKIEEVVWEGPRHKIVVAPWIVLCVFALLVGIAGSLYTLNVIPFVLGLIVAGFAGWHIMQWKLEWRLITKGGPKGGRLVVISGPGRYVDNDGKRRFKIVSVGMVNIADIVTASISKTASSVIAGIPMERIEIDTRAQHEKVQALPDVPQDEVPLVIKLLTG